MVTVAHADFGEDAWRWRGLGKIAARIWYLLHDPEVSIGRLPALLGVKPRTVRRHLSRLAHFALIRQDGRNWVPVDDPVLRQKAAISTLVAGKGERQRHQHALQRFAFNAKLEGLARTQPRVRKAEVMKARRDGSTRTSSEASPAKVREHR